MAQGSQIVEVKVIRGKFAGEGEAAVEQFRAQGVPDIPVTLEEQTEALSNAAKRAIEFLTQYVKFAPGADVIRHESDEPSAPPVGPGVSGSDEAAMPL